MPYIYSNLTSFSRPDFRARADVTTNMETFCSLALFLLVHRDELGDKVNVLVGQFVLSGLGVGRPKR